MALKDEREGTGVSQVFSHVFNYILGAAYK
jgi:hypothetical protein